ncbi:MAG: hypothetical protein OET21_04630, partial [Desulfobacterales bacterium]|nr:hypothetical protein [Desulfobacterales bacterium]
KLPARNVNRVAGLFQAGEVQRDAARARPPAHRQRDVATSRADVEDAQGGIGMAPLRFGGQKTPDHPDAAEATIDRLHEPVTGGGQRRITVWPVQKLCCRGARVKHPRALPLP